MALETETLIHKLLLKLSVAVSSSSHPCGYHRLESFSVRVFSLKRKHLVFQTSGLIFFH